MDTRTLKNFLTLAEQLHFGRASELCYLSPSALSRNIRQLEEELGTPLFERDNRRVALTQQGVSFQQYARNALSEWELIKSTLQDSSKQLQGELRLFSSVTASYSLLHTLLGEFRSRHPAIEIKLHTGDPEHAISRVVADEEDLAIAARPEQLPKNLAFKALTTSPLLWIAATDSAKAMNSLIQQQQWQEIPMIVAEGGVGRKRIDGWFRSSQCKPNIYAQVTGNEAIASMVSLGFGVGVVPQLVLENSPARDRLTVLKGAPQLAPYEVGLCTLNRKLKSPVVKAFWELPA